MPKRLDSSITLVEVMKLARNVAHRYYYIYNRRFDEDDLISTATLHAWKAFQKSQDINYIVEAAKKGIYDRLRYFLAKKRSITYEYYKEIITSPIYELDNRDFWEQCMNKLKPNQRDIIEMRLIDGLSAEEIATKLKVSRRAVQRRIKIIIERLRRAV